MWPLLLVALSVLGGCMDRVADTGPATPHRVVADRGELPAYFERLVPLDHEDDFHLRLCAAPEIRAEEVVGLADLTLLPHTPRGASQDATATETTIRLELPPPSPPDADVLKQLALYEESCVDVHMRPGVETLEVRVEGRVLWRLQRPAFLAEPVVYGATDQPQFAVAGARSHSRRAPVFSHIETNTGICYGILRDAVPEHPWQRWHWHLESDDDVDTGHNHYGNYLFAPEHADPHPGAYFVVQSPFRRFRYETSFTGDCPPR